jgi:cell division protein FtsL
MKKGENVIGKILGGGFLLGDRSLRALPFIGYLTLLALLAIKCAHSIDEKVIKINKMRSEMKELEAEFLETRAQVMELGQESKVINQAKSLGLQEAQVPPKKIIINHE